MLSSLATLVDLTILTQIVVLHLALDLVFRVTLGGKNGGLAALRAARLQHHRGGGRGVLRVGRLRGVVRRRGRTIGPPSRAGSMASRRRSPRLSRYGGVPPRTTQLVVLVVPEYRTTAFVGHHAATFVLALLSQAPYLHYYGLFFFGVASVSSVPLAVVEVAKCAGLTRLHDRARGVFAAAFLALRSLYWPLVSLGFWADSVAALRGAVAVHSVADVVTFLVANIGLTGLRPNHEGGPAAEGARRRCARQLEGGVPARATWAPAQGGGVTSESALSACMQARGVRSRSPQWEDAPPPATAASRPPIGSQVKLSLDGAAHPPRRTARRRRRPRRSPCPPRRSPARRRRQS